MDIKNVLAELLDSILSDKKGINGADAMVDLLMLFPYMVDLKVMQICEICDNNGASKHERKKTVAKLLKLYNKYLDYC